VQCTCPRPRTEQADEGGKEHQGSVVDQPKRRLEAPDTLLASEANSDNLASCHADAVVKLTVG
jgi:hypothetical protein